MFTNGSYCVSSMFFLNELRSYSPFSSGSSFRAFSSWSVTFSILPGVGSVAALTGWGNFDDQLTTYHVFLAIRANLRLMHESESREDKYMLHRLGADIWNAYVPTEESSPLFGSV